MAAPRGERGARLGYPREVSSVRTIEIRRHSLRESGPHISEAGRRLARRVAAMMAPSYELVVCSDKVRARETAEAMGFAVDVEDPAFSVMDTAELRPWFPEMEDATATRGCGQLAAAFHVPGAATHLRKRAEAFAQALDTYVPRLSDGGRALVISHGWAIEQVAALFMPEFALERIGGEFAPCEGFSLWFVPDGGVVGLDVHRLVRRS